MIAKFDKVTLQKMRNELNAVLAKYAQSEGLEISIGNIKFSETDFEAKLNCKIAGAKTFVDTMLESAMRTYNLNQNGVGNRRLVSYNSRNYRYPFIYEQNGKRFKCSAEQAEAYFKKI